MLVPLCKHDRALNALRKGISVSVICDADDYDKHYRDNYYRMLGFSLKTKTKSCTILSEIGNMPNHFVVVGAGGRIVDGLHSDIFYVDTEDECWSDDVEHDYEEPPKVMVDQEYEDHTLIEAYNALSFCDDVLSRRPYSAELHHDGTHPNDRISEIRSALEKMNEVIRDKGLQPK